MSAGQLPRTMRQPGPPGPVRISAVAARGRSITFELAKGMLLVEAVRAGFAAHGYASGVVELRNAALSPFAYVMPALSKTGENAAFYSDIFRPEGVTMLREGALTFGLRDGAPFFHCHGLWVEPDGRPGGGHIIPDETYVAETCRVTALGLDGAAFEGRQDPEINFKVFGPVVAPPASGRSDTACHAIRLHPNIDFHTALEMYCHKQGIARARIRGGVGSTIGVIFEDGRQLPGFATEFYVRQGQIAPDATGAPVASIDIGVIEYLGNMAEGYLKRGDSPVLMTVELALEVEA